MIYIFYRALLRNSSLLLCDELGSSVDETTYTQIEKAIKKKFLTNGSTVIMVAHR